MALINCKECGQPVSDKAVKCPNCGVTLKENVSSVTNATNGNSIRTNQGNSNQDINWVLVVVSILVPIVGIVLYFMEKDKNKQLAKICLICGLVVTIIEGIWFITWQVQVYRAEKFVEDTTEQYMKEVDKASKQMQRELEKFKRNGY